MNSKKYTAPLAQIVEFDAIDIITASGNNGNGGNSGSGGGFEGEWDFNIPEISYI